MKIEISATQLFTSGDELAGVVVLSGEEVTSAAPVHLTLKGVAKTDIRLEGPKRRVVNRLPETLFEQTRELERLNTGSTVPFEVQLPVSAASYEGRQLTIRWVLVATLGDPADRRSPAVALELNMAPPTVAISAKDLDQAAWETKVHSSSEGLQGLHRIVQLDDLLGEGRYGQLFELKRERQDIPQPARFSPWLWFLLVFSLVLAPVVGSLLGGYFLVDAIGRDWHKGVAAIFGKGFLLVLVIWCGVLAPIHLGRRQLQKRWRRLFGRLEIAQWRVPTFWLAGQRATVGVTVAQQRGRVLTALHWRLVRRERVAYDMRVRRKRNESADIRISRYFGEILQRGAFDSTADWARRTTLDFDMDITIPSDASGSVYRPHKGLEWVLQVELHEDGDQTVFTEELMVLPLRWVPNQLDGPQIDGS